MLEAFRRAFQTKDIRKKIGYTFLMLIVIELDRSCQHQA